MAMFATFRVTSDEAEARSLLRALRDAGLDAAIVEGVRVVVPRAQLEAARRVEVSPRPEVAPPQPERPEPGDDRPVESAPVAGPLTAVDVGVSGVTAQLRRAWPLWWRASPIVACLLLGTLFVEAFVPAALAATLWLGLLVVWSPVRIAVDAHGLRVGRRRLLWEDLVSVTLEGDTLAWVERDGESGTMTVPMSDRDRERLRKAIEGRPGQVRAPRDRRAEAAVRALVER